MKSKIEQRNFVGIFFVFASYFESKMGKIETKIKFYKQNEAGEKKMMGKFAFFANDLSERETKIRR